MHAGSNPHHGAQKWPDAFQGGNGDSIVPSFEGSFYVGPDPNQNLFRSPASPVQLNAPFSLFFALFVHVFDRWLENHQVGRADAVDLEAILVIPLDDAVDFLAVMQNQYHRRLGLHLFLVIKVLRVGVLRRRRLLRGSVCMAVIALGALACRRRGRMLRRMMIVVVAVERWADELAVGKLVGGYAALGWHGVDRIFHFFTCITSPA